MITQLLRHTLPSLADPLDTALYDENTCYAGFLEELRSCREDLLIESPFLSERRVRMMSYTLLSLARRGVLVSVNTRHPNDLDADRWQQAWETIHGLMGIQLRMIPGNHHRKIAVIDGRVLCEGSLNILSRNHSQEIMRRIKSRSLVSQMQEFLESRWR